MRDFEPLHATHHMLRWFGEDPYEAIEQQCVAWLTRQVPGCRLTGLRVAGEPDWITGARPGTEDPAQVEMLRTGVAFPFQLLVDLPDGEEVLVEGVYTWVAWALDTDHPSLRVWIDVDGTMDAHGRQGSLPSRVNTPEA